MDNVVYDELNIVLERVKNLMINDLELLNAESGLSSVVEVQLGYGASNVALENSDHGIGKVA
ncbi:hypothetical protein [Ehrlichia minasensis]|nr:hypothetical protein [Ehrlichia minasensis]